MVSIIRTIYNPLTTDLELFVPGYDTDHQQVILPPGQTLDLFTVVTGDMLEAMQKELNPLVQGGQLMIIDTVDTASFNPVGSVPEPPGGVNTSVQFNNNGALSGDTSFTWDGALLTVGGNLSVTGATNLDNSSIYTDGAGSLVVTGHLTVNGTANLNGVSYNWPTAQGSVGEVLTISSVGIGSTLDWAAIPVAIPGGTSGQIQYNNAGAFAGASKITTDGTTLTLATPNNVHSITITSIVDGTTIDATSSGFVFVVPGMILTQVVGGNTIFTTITNQINIGVSPSSVSVVSSVGFVPGPAHVQNPDSIATLTGSGLSLSDAQRENNPNPPPGQIIANPSNTVSLTAATGLVIMAGPNQNGGGVSLQSSVDSNSASLSRYGHLVLNSDSAGGPIDPLIVFGNATSGNNSEFGLDQANGDRFAFTGNSFGGSTLSGPTLTYITRTGQLFVPAAVYVGGTSPVNSWIGMLSPLAVLQADSTHKGFLPPRMTTAQRNNISPAATGSISTFTWSALSGSATVTIGGTTITEGIDWIDRPVWTHDVATPLVGRSTWSITNQPTLAGVGVVDNAILMDAIPQFSISLWVKDLSGNTNGTFGILLSKGSNSGNIVNASFQGGTLGNNPGWFFFFGQNAYFGFCIQTDVNNGVMATAVSFPADGNWHNLIVTKDASNNMILYQDGTQVGTGIVTGTFTTVSNSFPVTVNDDGDLSGTDGRLFAELDEIRMWSSVLSPSDVTAIATGGDPTGAAALAYWTIEEGSGVILNDSVGLNTIGFGSNSATATSIVNAVAANNTLNNLVDATSIGGVVNIAAKDFGPSGNLITLAISDNVNMAVSGSTLSGGGATPLPAGLMIYNLDSNTMNYWNGSTTWVSF